MAQSTDLVVPNTSAAGVRSAINTRLLAIATHQSGATAPATTYAYQFWADTTAGLLKQRDGANSAWITIGTLGTANLGLAALASPTFTGTPAAPTATAGTNTTQLATTAFVAAAVANASPVLETVKNATGTSVDFTGIPSWVKRITVMFNGVSTSGSSSQQIQLGTGSGPTFATSGYNGASAAVNMISNGSAEANTTGFRVTANQSGSDIYYGAIQLLLVTGNTWVESGTLNVAAGRISVSSGSNALGAVLTAIRITTVNGTDTFDAGSINILYE